MWSKGTPATPNLPNRFAGPCKLLAFGMIMILIENTQALCYVIGWDVSPRYESVTDPVTGDSHRERTAAYWTVVITSFIGMVSAVSAFLWYFQLSRYYATKDRLYGAGGGTNTPKQHSWSYTENSNCDDVESGSCNSGGNRSASAGTCSYVNNVKV
ncbi:unnamed protein product [Amoebophrya sp. A120]|nr:unnamed protein product [Amoebophrya sp. A120]|eukprot:GSA120T00015680001.1